MTDEELKVLRLERKDLARKLIYTKMPEHPQWIARHRELGETIEAEVKRRRALSGYDLTEQQLQNDRELVETNSRMAEATEASARASADAARWAKWAAIFTALAAVAALVTTWLQVRG